MMKKTGMAASSTRRLYIEVFFSFCCMILDSSSIRFAKKKKNCSVWRPAFAVLQVSFFGSDGKMFSEVIVFKLLI